MEKYCKKCNGRMMIFQEGYPCYTHGTFILYGCTECGNVEYYYDNSNCEGNPIKVVYDPQDISKYHVSN